MLRGVIAGNVERCRTEAEIWDESGKKLAVIFEDASGWHTELSDEHFDQGSDEFKSFVAGMKQELSRFVNRKGQNPPENATSRSPGALADEKEEMVLVAVWHRRGIESTAMHKSMQWT